jgi:hypothetical protein
MDTFVVALIAKLIERLPTYDACKVIAIVLEARDDEINRQWSEV